MTPAAAAITATVIVRTITSVIVRAVITRAVITAVVIRAITVVVRARHRIHIGAVIPRAGVVRYTGAQAQAEHNSEQDSTGHGGLLDRKEAAPATLGGVSRSSKADSQ
jgi:hypothetical protein